MNYSSYHLNHIHRHYLPFARKTIFMLKIELENLFFFAYHGIHEEEKNNGGNFDVSVSIGFEPRFFPVKY